ncbi:MAG TPA: autotransporter domain-containing protein, partial [Candidatus Methylacidiphilales bacterium]
LSPLQELRAQQDPFTISGSNLTLIANPNPTYTNPAAGLSYVDSANTYTVTLNPAATLNVSSSMTEPLIRIGDGTTNNPADANSLVTNANLTLTSTAESTDTFFVNGILVGTNNGTISSTSSGGIALGVNGTLGLTSTNAFINNGTISGTANSIIANNIGYFENTATGNLTGTVFVSNGATGTITYFSNAGTINANGQRDGIQADVVTTLVNSGSISNDNTNGIYITTSLGTLTNSGHISGGDDGIEVLGNGNITLITNQAGGTISGTLQSGIQSNETINDLENYGSITGGASGNGIGALGGNGIVLLNNYAGATISGFNGINASGLGTVVNGGTIQGNGGDGITTETITSLTNTGTIAGQEGIHAAGQIGTLVNSGNITGAATFSGIDAYSINSLSMSAGNITGGLYGITTRDYANITLSGGTIRGGAGQPALYLNSSTENSTSNVVINGGADVEGLMEEEAGNGKLTLNLIGLSPEQQAELQSKVGHSVDTFMGPARDFYQWNGLILQGTGGGGAITFPTLAPTVDRGIQPLATAIDTNGLPAGTQYNSVISAATANPEAALQSLSGREITEGFQDIKVNINNGLISQLDNQLDNLPASPAGGLDFSNLTVGTNQMIAFNDMSTQLSGLVQNATISDVAGTEIGPATAPADAHKWGLWVDGTVSFAHEDQRGAQPGYHALFGTPTAGLSYRVTPHMTIGALANYTVAGADFGDGGKINLNSEIGGAFATWNQGPWQVHGFAAGGASQYRNQRVTLDGSTATSSPDGSDVLTDLTGGYQINLGHGFKITPQLGVQYTHIHKDATNESGSDLGLDVDSQDIDSIRSHLGFILTRSFQIDDKLQFIPEFRAAWYHEYLDNNDSVNTSLQTAPALGSFAITSINSPQRDYALLGVGLNTAFTGYGLPIGLFVNYDVQAGQGSYLQHNVSAGFRVAF